MSDALGCSLGLVDRIHRLLDAETKTVLGISHFDHPILVLLEHQAEQRLRMPEVVARMIPSMRLASRRGEFAATDPALEQLRRRSARSIRTVLERVLAGS